MRKKKAGVVIGDFRFVIQSEPPAEFGRRSYLLREKQAARAPAELRHATTPAYTPCAVLANRHGSLTAFFGYSTAFDQNYSLELPIGFANITIIPYVTDPAQTRSTAVLEFSKPRHD